MSNSKYDKRVYAGYYKRYDGKLFYVVTMAKDGEIEVLWHKRLLPKEQTIAL